MSRVTRGTELSLMDPVQVERSTSNLLHFLLFVKIFLLFTSISFLSIALLADAKDLRRYFPESYSNNRSTMIHSGIYLGLFSAVTGLANIFALFGLRTWRRFFLVPYLGLLFLGAMFSFIYLLGAMFFWSFQQELNLAAMVGTLICSALLLRMLPVFLMMGIPRTVLEASLEAGMGPSSPSFSTSSDLPPNYSALDSTVDSQLPGYDDSIVEKMDCSLGIKADVDV